MADWAKLNPDILFMVANKHIRVAEDFESFSCVCTSWRDVTLREGSEWLLQQHGSIIIPAHMRRSHRLLSLRTLSICRLSLPVNLKKKRFAYTHGWTLIDSHKAPEMSLIHTISHDVISLPPRTELNVSRPPQSYKRATLSCSPRFFPDNYILMISYGFINPQNLSFWKPGDRTWTMIETSNIVFEDITYCRDKFYVVDSKGIIYVCDIGLHNLSLIGKIGKIFKEGHSVRYYFARQTGIQCSLLIVSKFFRTASSYEYGVYELDLNGKGVVEEVNDLKDRTIFLGVFCQDSICCRHPKFPSGIVPVDCIQCHDFRCLKICRKDCVVSKRLYNRAISMDVYGLKGEKVTKYFCC